MHYSKSDKTALGEISKHPGIFKGLFRTQFLWFLPSLVSEGFRFRSHREVRVSLLLQPHVCEVPCIFKLAMSQEFQLQLIRKTLDELGHSDVADLLALKLSENSHDYSSLISSLQGAVVRGNYEAALRILKKDSEEFDFRQSSPKPQFSAQQKNVAAYLIVRAQYLELVLRLALHNQPIPTESDLLAFLNNEVMEHFNAVDRHDTSVPLVLRLTGDLEASFLLSLAMTPPTAAQVESAIFAPLLTFSDQKQRTLYVLTDFRSYVVRLHNSLSSLLLDVLATENSDDSNWTYADIPDNCLATIIDSALKHTLLQTLYYLPPRLDALDTLLLAILSSHANVTANDLPTNLLHTLKDHTDEVWFTRFSPLGRFLATGSLDGTCIIYDVLDSFKTVAELDSNEENEDAVFVEGTHKPGLDKKKGIISLCWEPHERYIVTCCLDTVIRVWRVENITHSKRITRSMDDVRPASLISAFTLGERMRTWPCEFLHYDPSMTPHFIVGSPDKVLKVFTVDGQEVLDFYSDADEWLSILDEGDKWENAGSESVQEHIKTEPSTNGNGTNNGNGEPTSASQFKRINDFAITPNGKVLITANNDKQVFFYKIPDLFDPTSTTFRIALLSLNGRLTSCSVSADGKYMLISIAPEEIQVWDISPLDDFQKPYLKQKFLGQSQALYMVRSSFGYLVNSTNREELVLSGSDDGYVYIWKLETGQLMTRVRAHHGLCNSVDWNRFYKPPKQGKDYGNYWCSVGDDKLVKIWGPRS